MLELKDIQFQAGGKTLLALDHLGIEPGFVTAIIGPNGAGKSTALKLLSGEHRPTGGEAFLDGAPLAGLGAGVLAQRRAVVTQSASLNFDFMVWEVAALGRQPLAPVSSAEKDRAAVAEALRMVDCLALAERRYLTLSGGERQRVHFARALAQVLDPPPGADAQYLLLDEPTSALDLKYQIDCLEIARDFARNSNGVAVILHDLNLAKEFADQIYLLGAGRLVAKGPPDTVLVAKHIQPTYDLTDERMAFALSGLTGLAETATAPPLPSKPVQAAE